MKQNNTSLWFWFASKKQLNNSKPTKQSQCLVVIKYIYLNQVIDWMLTKQQSLK